MTLNPDGGFGFAGVRAAPCFGDSGDRLALLLLNPVIVESLVLPAFARGYALVNQVIVESLVLPASRVVMLW